MTNSYVPPPPGGELGYAQITSAVTQTSLTPTAVAGLSTVVTVGARPVVVSFDSQFVSNSTSGDGAVITIQEDGVTVASALIQIPATSGGVPTHREARRAPAAGSHTYTILLSAVTAGTAQISATATNPAFIQVREI